MIKIQTMTNLLDGNYIEYGMDIFINPSSIDLIIARLYSNREFPNGIYYSQLRVGSNNYNIPVLFDDVGVWFDEVTKKRPLNIKMGGNV